MSVTIHKHQVKAGNKASRKFSIKNESIRLVAWQGDEGAEADYLARIVRASDLGLGYGRGVYTYDRLIQIPPEASDGDELFLLADYDSQYHTHYRLELGPEVQGAVIKAVRLNGDQLEE